MSAALGEGAGLAIFADGLVPGDENWPAASTVGVVEYVDGVVAVDPIALSQIMSGTGPVKLENGLTITAGNVAQVLLNTIYMTVADPAAQDAFYEAAARNVFKAVVGGQGDQTTVLSGLATAADPANTVACSLRCSAQG